MSGTNRKKRYERCSPELAVARRLVGDPTIGTDRLTIPHWSAGPPYIWMCAPSVSAEAENIRLGGGYE